MGKQSDDSMQSIVTAEMAPLRMGMAVSVALKWAGAHMDIHSGADKAGCIKKRLCEAGSPLASSPTEPALPSAVKLTDKERF